MTFASAALALVTLGLSSSSLLVNAGLPIDTWELLAAGLPYGEVFTLEPFDAKVYYESKAGATINTTVYKNVATGSPCSSGKEILENITTKASVGGNLNLTNSTTDGKFSSVQLTSADIKSTGAYKAIGGNDGKVNLCVRSFLFVEMNSTPMVVSYVDTHLELFVDFTAKFQNFTQEVNITATSAKEFTQNITKNVEVQASVCVPNNKTELPKTYKIGQDFSVCVSPTPKYQAESYSVSGFENVTCENAGSTRELVSNSKYDALTTNFSLSTNGTFGFTSVVTAGFFSKGNKNFTCTGDVALKLSGGRRALSAFSASFSGDVSRNLQAEESAPFATQINLDTEDPALLASAAMSFGWSSLVLGTIGSVLFMTL